MHVHKDRTGASAGDLIPLELWYTPGDHYLVASDAGIADARAGGYRKLGTLGYERPFFFLGGFFSGFFPGFFSGFDIVFVRALF